ncbi:MAG: membrane dipeptidase [Spirochaetes bacterium]|nr:membrane dipeptidase [Spirochaetota bacterium]
MSDFYFDVHGHREGIMPAAMRLVPGNTIPPDFRLRDCRAAGISGFVLCVLGDPNTFLPIKVDPCRQVLADLAKAKSAAAKAEAEVVRDATELDSALSDGKPAFLLGIEGGDFIGEDLDRVDEVYEAGVRLIGLVHYSANSIGSIAYGWGGRIIPQAERTGLSAFGRKVVARANELGMIVDLAHADEETAFAALDAAIKPPICSHTGPRALQAFPRYISDALMKRIAEAGGLVGLWLFRIKEAGIPDLETFGNYAAYCASVVGPEHLSIGSDINGVPGNAVGYENPFDAPKLLETLAAKGFSKAESQGIAGGTLRTYLRALDG